MVRVLAVSSGGGHWQQLQLLAPSLAGADVTYACSCVVDDPEVLLLPDCNLRTPRKLCLGLISAIKIVREIRPDVVISTGAAPGALTLVIAKLSGSRTIWIDSLANVDRMSLSGRIVHRFCDLWMTQWRGVAVQSGAVYVGSIL